VREGDRLELSQLMESRASACSPGCGMCFLAQIYGFVPREIALIALISAGKTGHAIDQTLGVGMPTILQYCGRIHGKIGTRSRSELVYGRYAKGW
jgi:DNA-binding CsgD family transcriptional regulator